MYSNVDHRFLTQEELVDEILALLSDYEMSDTDKLGCLERAKFIVHIAGAADSAGHGVN